MPAAIVYADTVAARMQLHLRTRRPDADAASDVHPTVDLQIVPQPDVPPNTCSRSAEDHQRAVVRRVLDRSKSGGVPYAGVVVVWLGEVDVGVAGTNVPPDLQGSLRSRRADADVAAHLHRERGGIRREVPTTSRVSLKAHDTVV